MDTPFEEIAAFKWAPTSGIYWEGYEGIKSGCESGGTSYTCSSQSWEMIERPWLNFPLSFPLIIYRGRALKKCLSLESTTSTKV